MSSHRVHRGFLTLQGKCVETLCGNFSIPSHMKVADAPRGASRGCSCEKSSLCFGHLIIKLSMIECPLWEPHREHTHVSPVIPHPSRCCRGLVLHPPAEASGVSSLLGVPCKTTEQPTVSKRGETEERKRKNLQEKPWEYHCPLQRPLRFQYKYQSPFPLCSGVLHHVSARRGSAVCHSSLQGWRGSTACSLPRVAPV